MALEEVEKLNRQVTMEEIKTFVTELPLKNVTHANSFTVASTLKQQIILHYINCSRVMQNKESFLNNFVGRNYNTDINLIKIIHTTLSSILFIYAYIFSKMLTNRIQRALKEYYAISKWSSFHKCEKDSIFGNVLTVLRE